MGDFTHFVTMKFSGADRNYINHLYLGSLPDQAAIDQAVSDLEDLTGDTSLLLPGEAKASVVSITKTLKRTVALEDIKEANDLVAVNPHIITGRLLQYDNVAVPPRTNTSPFIMRGVNPSATLPPGFSNAVGSNYLTWIKEFLIKYGKVFGQTATGVTIVKDVLQH